MVAFLLMFAALALAVLAWRGRARTDRPRIARLVTVWLASAGLLRLLAELYESGFAHAAPTPLLAAAALAGLVAWGALASLTALEPKRLFRFFRLPMFAIAVMIAFAGGPWPAVVTFTVFATLSFRWADALTTRQRFAAAMGLVAFAALSVPGWADGDALAAPAAGSATATLLAFVRAANALMLTYALIAILPTVRRFVKDPTLGIRTVSRRVALSHTLVVVVPLLITLTLWVLTTYLGAGADRALVASRAIAAEAAGLRGALAQALATPGPAEPALRALAAARRAEWPGTRVWLFEGGEPRRVAGAAVDGEADLSAWVARLDSLPASGVVQMHARRWLGAAVRDGGRAAVALVPIGEAVAGSPSRLAGAPVRMREEVKESWRDRLANAADSLEAFTDSLDATGGDPGDSVALARLHGVTRTLGLPDSAVKIETGRPSERGVGRLRMTTGSDTLDVSEEGGNAGTGRANVAGLQFGRDGWSKVEGFGLTVKVGFRDALAGFYRNVQANPYNLIPLLVLYGLLALFLPVAFFNFNVVRQLGRSVTEPVAALRGATAALGAGRLEHRIELRGDDELWDTAGAFNRMAEGLEVAREREKEREKLEAELDLARRIQARLLPAGPPVVGGLEISGHSESAREVGGDYFDHLVLEDGRVLLVIADVSGKGVPAALLMSAFRASLMSQDASRGDPAEVASHLNEFLHRSVDPGKFVTAFVGFLDPRDGRFVYANAGHNPPVLLRADGRVEWLNTGGLILGILSPSFFEAGQVTIEPGDLLALYTDGVTEGADASGELFGEDRLVELLKRRAAEPCADLAGHLVREVRDFEGEQGPADDITVLLARRARG